MFPQKLKAALINLVEQQEGAAFIEFAIMLPVAALLFMGVVEFGYIIKEWRRLNDLLEAQVLYLSASSNENKTPTNGTQFIATPAASAATITSAVSQSNSGISSNDATVVTTTFGCACATNSGATSTVTFSSIYTMATCPAPPDNTCENNSFWHIYAKVAATKQHTTIFFPFWHPNMTANALVRIF